MSKLLPRLDFSEFDAAMPAMLQKQGALICFSHLRWDFVLQRPQHLMQRFAQNRRVFYFEEQIPTDHHLPYLEFHPFAGTEIIALRPRVPHWWDDMQREDALRLLLDMLLSVHGGAKPVLWFYTPMMYRFAQHVDAAAVVYDCMDELANFRFASSGLAVREAELMARADVVFTGGYSLYEAKRRLHHNVHLFPSSVDSDHFHAARAGRQDPPDQASLPAPRLGFYGVIDERLDLELLKAAAQARPTWSFVMIGPIVKISQDELPKAPNIHYLGRKDYSELPRYISGWDVALLPFAISEATQFISPTKTPEYLAGGRPVVSTAIADVDRHFGDLAGVTIARSTEDFIEACDRALSLAQRQGSWLPQVDARLNGQSWDATFAGMAARLTDAEARGALPRPAPIASGSGRRASEPYDVLVVGAGFAGSVLAERLAAGSGRRVLVCDRRPHLGGNAHDCRDPAGILVHRYGPHIFHTNSEEIFRYLSRFTRWRPYEHRVLASVGDKLLPMPINRATLEGLYDIDLPDEDATAAFLAERAERIAEVRTARDIVVSQVGGDLYRTFFQGYTRKQWGLDPCELDKSVTARVPARTSLDDRYFLDRFQAMPLDGFTRLFERMLDHERINVELGLDFKDIKGEALARHIVYTGPIDEFFDYRFGRLPYRSLTFRHETFDVGRFQPVAVVNYPAEDIPYTRITEYKHLTGQVHPKTSISYEYACADGDPYYPVPRPENLALYRRYEALGAGRSDVTFVGRLGTYRYYNMDQVVGQALATYRRMAGQERASADAVMVRT